MAEASDVAPDVSAAHITISTPSLLQNAQACANEVGQCVVQLDTNRYILPDGWNSALAVTQDEIHSVLPISVTLSARENGTTYKKAGESLQVANPQLDFYVLGNMAEAIDVGLQSAGVSVSR